jgi:hypothetical protein
MQTAGANFAVINTGSARFGTNEEVRSEDSTQLLKESLEHIELVQGVLRQYQEHDHAGPMENETGKQALRTFSGHAVADSKEKRSGKG